MKCLNDPTRETCTIGMADIALNPHFKGFEQDTHSQFGDFSSFFSGFGGHGTQPYQGSEDTLVTAVHYSSSKTLKEPWQDVHMRPFPFGTGGRARTRRASGCWLCTTKRGGDITVDLKIDL